MNKLEATVKLKCPRCHEGELFENKNPFLGENYRKCTLTAQFVA